jgi:hypothetical protein
MSTKFPVCRNRYSVRPGHHIPVFMTKKFQCRETPGCPGFPDSGVFVYMHFGPGCLRGFPDPVAREDSPIQLPRRIPRPVAWENSRTKSPGRIIRPTCLRGSMDKAAWEESTCLGGFPSPVAEEILKPSCLGGFPAPVAKEDSKT